MEIVIKTFIANQIDDKLLQQNIRELDEITFPKPWTENQWLDLFHRDDYIISLAFKKGHLIGLTLTGLSKHEELGHLYKIMISKSLRGTSAAQHLFDELCNSMRSENIKRIFLEVSVLNSQAIAFYKKQDFEVLNRVKNFYSNTEDAFAMHKSL